MAVHRTESGYVDGFLAVCVTGANPFQPLVVLRAYGPGTLEALILESLLAGRSYMLSVPVHVGAALEGLAHGAEAPIALTDKAVWRVLRADLSAFSPMINVLVTRQGAPGGGHRWEIQARGRVVAAAGVNWRDDRWAEVYVAADQEARDRRWDESVLAAATSALLSQGVTPLYPVLEHDGPSLRVAESRGYSDSGAREFTCAMTAARRGVGSVARDG
jgi:hypothetical protein